MSGDALLQQIPPIARYRREPLDDHQNALFYWDEAARVMVGLGDDALYDQLVCERPESCDPAPFPSGPDAEKVRRFLDGNRRSLELLRTGVRCEQLQFPEPDDQGNDVVEHAAAIGPLVQLSHAWFIHARALIADGDLAPAASELVALGQMGQMVCCGEALVMHYLVGSTVMAMALAGVRLLTSGQEVPRDALAELLATVDRWLASAGDVAQCLRVDLNCFSLREIDRLAGGGGLESLVDQLLERHYAKASVLSSDQADVDNMLADDGRLAWRRDQILFLLRQHPAPFDRVATARLMGRLVADRILDLQSPRWFNLAGRWSRFPRRYRRSKFRFRSHLWPNQLRPMFPCEYLGPSDAARRRLTELKRHITADQWAEMQPPTREKLEAVRRRLQSMPNALGVLVADALLAADILAHEHLRRRRLHAARAVIAAALTRAIP